MYIKADSRTPCGLFFSQIFMNDLPKAYQPSEYEDRIYHLWEQSGLFNPDVCIEQGITSKDAEHFSIVLPPPNVTGTLHMGHAVMLAVEDAMVRFKRMQGFRTLWVPGTDHAAVATESKVEKLLMEEGMENPKKELGREDFLKRIEEFAQKSHDTIVNQAKKMGSSLDWSREAYTLDEQRSKAVRKVFVDLYNKGLIYRGYRVVNWSVKGQSTCSDDELEHKERPATLYTFKYSADFPIPISTTRPETKVGDTAVAVHPEGKWKQYIGQTFEVKDVGQAGHSLTIKVIADEEVDDAFGTGALGVTPAHSMIDFDMYERQKAAGNDIGLIQVIGEDGKMTMQAGAAYVGKTVEEARRQFVAYLQEHSLLIEQEEIVQNVGTSDRFKDVVEPLPKTQWFIDVNKPFVLEESKIDGLETGTEVTLKKIMQHVIRNGNIEIIPTFFEKTYFYWIDNLRDWNISRQIWFGHRIPVWYRGEEMVVGETAPEGNDWEQDPDTLDTWFSSGLWTFSALGWTGEGDVPDVQNYHPTSVIETGYDILPIWVARMILMTTFMREEIPFKQVYLHGLVRDEQGRKMSKSLGNIINPLDMIDTYGTDATRLSLMIGASAGNDSKLSEDKIAGFRNFTNKLWNMSRFMLMNIDTPHIPTTAPTPKTTADAWVLSRLQTVIDEVTKGYEAHAFSHVGEILRDFTWQELADWYLEIAKAEEDKSEILNYLLHTLLALWHPLMPFVTEAIWKHIHGDDAFLMVHKFPTVEASLQQPQAEKNMHVIKEVITGIRSLRADYRIEPAKKVTVQIDTPHNGLIEENQAVIMMMARVETLHLKKLMEESAQTVSLALGSTTITLDLSGSIDTEKEIERLQKEKDHVAPYILSLEKKLGNAGFVDNAPEAVVQKEQEKLAEAKAQLASIESQLAALI